MGTVPRIKQYTIDITFYPVHLIILQLELRQDYGDPNLGTCLESLIGGNHFRFISSSLTFALFFDFLSEFSGKMVLVHVQARYS